MVMEILRLFIAIQLPGPLKDALTSAQKILVKANNNIRPTSLAGMHLTLKFLGDTPADQIPAIRQAMEQAAAQVSAPINLHCAGTGAFPKLDAPRVLWAGLSGSIKELGALFRTLDLALEQLGFPPEKRGLHPHVTLGRMRIPKQLSALRKAWPKVEHLDFGDFTADALVLYRSELKPGGAEYTSIERVPLPI